MSRINAVLTLVLLTLPVGVIAAESAGSTGQLSNWSRPVPISPEGVMAWFPDIVADRTGRVHVAWSSGTVGYDQVMYSYMVDGVLGNELNDVVALPQVAGSEASRPALFADQRGGLHMTFRSTSVYYAQAPAVNALPVSAWSSPLPLSSGQVAYFSRVAVDQKGYLHLVYTENVPTNNCAICFHLFYRRSEDGGLTWSPARDISVLPTGAAKPQLLIDEQDNIHVVWEAGLGGAYGQLEDPTQVMYAGSYDSGVTWSSPVRLVRPGSQMQKNVTIGLAKDGQLIVAWLSLPQDVIYYQVSRNQGRNWSSAERIGQVWGGWTVYPGRLDDYAMATDSASDAHLVLVGRVSEDEEKLNLIKLTWDGQSWSRPEVIQRFVGDVPEWPRIAVGQGNQLHVAWFVRDEEHIWESDAGQYRIWYARSESAAPMIESVAEPTAVVEQPLSATLSPVTATVPTPTPGAAFESTPVISQVSNTIYGETDELILLLQSIVPVMALVAIVAIGVRVRRR